jgi:hypothetical protein
VVSEILRRLVTPGDEVFYTLFNEGADIAVKISSRLSDLLMAYDEGTEMNGSSRQEIKMLYAKSQNHYRETVKRLSRVFITPIDREAVHELSTNLHAISRSLYLVPRYIHRDNVMNDTHIKHLSHLIEKCVFELKQMVEEIGTPRRRFVMKHAQQLHALRREMEITYDHALQGLYKNTVTPALFMQKIEAYNALLDVGECCQNAAHTAEGIVLTHVG